MRMNLWYPSDPQQQLERIHGAKFVQPPSFCLVHSKHQGVASYQELQKGGRMFPERNAVELFWAEELADVGGQHVGTLSVVAG